MPAMESFVPSLILLDIMLPGMDGYQVCREVRAKYPVILDLLPQAFDVHVHSAGVPNVFVSPQLIQELFPGEDMVGGGGQEV